MAQLVELGLVETLSDSEMKSSGSPGGKTQSMLSSKETLMPRNASNVIHPRGIRLVNVLILKYCLHSCYTSRTTRGVMCVLHL